MKIFSVVLLYASENFQTQSVGFHPNYESFTNDFPGFIFYNKTMSNFKIVLTAIFAVCFVVGIVLFAMFKAGGGQAVSKITVWGTISSEAFDAAYKNATVSKNKNIIVTYVEKDPVTFDSDFVEALANQTGPDVVILRENSLYKNRNKLFTIPLASFSERDFKDLFVQEAELFIKPDGITALPLEIDPLVMYWNRDIFNNNSVANPPQYWDNIYGLVGTMTKKDSATNIMQSAISLGGWSNITNAKDIVALLLLQAGTPIVSLNGANYSSAIGSQLGYQIPPGQSALNFYTQFSNPTSASYSWNKSLPSSQNFFLSGDLALYIGFSSEIFSIQQKNPNLNFDVTNIPQIKNAQTKIDFAHMYASAIVKQSKYIPADFTLITSLIEPAAQTALEKVTNLPPVRRDLLSNKPTDPFRVVFYDSALISRSWIDPDSSASSDIFQNMVESITSGRSGAIEAVSNADQSLNLLLSK